MAFLAYFQLIIFIGSAFFVSLLLALYILQKATASPYPFVIRHKEEKFFLDPKTVSKIDFPSISDDPTLDLSVIVPAYDEEKRLPKMLDECLEYLEKKSQTSNFTYEVIVVSDGSRDGTVHEALKYSNKYTSNKVRVLELIENRGKGGAVRLGMLSARGKILLFADADGATKFSDYEKLENAIKVIGSGHSGHAIVVGSRAHLEDEAIATRSWFRTFLMHGFHFLVWLLAVKGIRDTQCGFKLFTRSAANIIFNALHVEKWAFDVEALHIAQKLKMPIEEIAVTWTEIDGSKVTPFWSWLQMGRDLFLIWFRYATGAWKIQKLHFS